METLVAAIILMIGLFSVAAVFDLSKNTTVKTRARIDATNLARELAEAARGVPYGEISDTSIPARLAAVDPSLADDEPGTPYTITRKGITYTVASTTCIMDDGRDGGGAVPRGGDFCTESVAAGTLDARNNRTDRLPEDYKRVDVVVNWDRDGRTLTVRQSTLVNNPGSAGAPAVLTLSANGVGSPPVVGPGTTALTFQLTTSSQPHTVRWLLDGAQQDIVCTNCSGKGPFSFNWNLESPAKADDGPFLISAEAFDAQGAVGPSRSTTIVLNRSQPIAPVGLAGGRNNGVVELEWLANPERDLTGYVVTRVEADSSQTVICPRQVATTCVDANPPAADTVRYVVTPYDVDMDGVTPRASANTSFVDVVKDNQPPKDPQNVTVTGPAADGSFTVSWQKPSPEDPDAGDRIAFYRIYRDGTLISDRIGRQDAAGMNETFVDGGAGAGAHRWWVTAVDTRYAESGFMEAQP